MNDSSDAGAGMQTASVSPHRHAQTVNFLTIAMQDQTAFLIDKVAALRRSWLRGFPDKVVADAASCCAIREVVAGTLIHARGADADGVYTIACGAVRFTRVTADGHATTIAVLEAPSWFGEISIFDGMPRTHDAHAAGACALLFHAKTDFKRLLARHPVIYEHFAKVMAMRLRATFDLVEEATTLPLAQRLARRLLELAHLRPSVMNAATIPNGRDVPLTQEELGHLLGKSRQSIAKQLRDWERNGLVETKYGHISIARPDALAHIAYPDAFAREARRRQAGAAAQRKETT
jgi:CRP-like cAMP-binding protein